MTTRYVIGNWKANKTPKDTLRWLDAFRQEVKKIPIDPHTKVIVCPPYTDVSVFHETVKKHNLPLILGAQDVSHYEEGSHTGEIPAALLEGLVKYVLIGHSERRREQHEKDDQLREKVKQAHAAGLKVVYCVQDVNVYVPRGVEMVAYEPVWAIGSGRAETPENADRVLGRLKKQTGVKVGIYGGSVVPDNANAFTAMEHIDGVLPGGASLKAKTFSQLIQSASAR